MAKDPAFLFYSQDWIVGCQTLTMEERGKYITILCQMHQQGRMTKETICLLVGSVSDNLMGKFRIDDTGKYYSERLEVEAKKRAKFTESRRENGSHGGRPTDKKQKKKPIAKPKPNHMDNHMEDENEDVIENEIVIVLPFDSENFKSAWSAWKQYKKEQHKFTYKGRHSEQIALKSLGEKSGNNEQTAIKIIQESIANGWNGLFELKINNNGKQQFGQGTDTEQLISRNKEFLRKSGLI